ncbi:MAG: ATP-binding protein [Coriobacteriia bacterium]|nr:ATP-binding protein [Coriobacteriia bacterium]
MLLQFSVENFKSFKDKAVLSLEASSDKNLLESTTIVKNERLLNSVGIFGSNASGKSNLFNAITAAILTIRWSSNKQHGQLLETIIPYKFRKNAYDIPTSFEFIYYGPNQKKYIYGFSATQKKIFTEYLYKYDSVKPTTIFDRDINREVEYKFTVPGLKTDLEAIKERNDENKLFLATAAQWNNKEAKDAIDWFLYHIDVHATNMDYLLKYSGKYFEHDTNNTLKKFTNKLLEKSDINITDFNFKAENLPGSQMKNNLFANNIDPNSFQDNSIYKNYTVNTKHVVLNEDSTKDNYELSLFEESLGTRTLFLLSPILQKAFNNGEVVCIDEFDNSLHPMLTIFLISLFNDKRLNTADAQLIVSSHTLEMMSDKLLRRDQIYFVDKNRNTASSELYSLDDYSVRHNVDRRKAYLLGRFNSVPNILSGEMLWR